MPVGAALGVGSIASAAIGSSAATSAANTQAQASRDAQASQAAMFAQIQKTLAPFVSAGTTAQQALLQQYGLAQTPTDAATQAAGYLRANPDIQQSWDALHDGTADPAALAWFKSLPPEAQANVNGFANWHQSTIGAQEGRPSGADPNAPAQKNLLTAPAQLNLTTPAFKSPDAFTPFTGKDLENTPGYKFALDQGLKSVKNAFSARGLGDSGALGKGLIDYATGKASETYDQQLQNYLTQQQQGYNQNVGSQNTALTQDLTRQQAGFQQDLAGRQFVINALTGQQSTGENAAAQTGTLGQQGQNSTNQLITGQGAATAAGQIGSASALASGITSASQIPLVTSLLSKSTAPPPLNPQAQANASQSYTYGTNYLTGG